MTKNWKDLTVFDVILNAIQGFEYIVDGDKHELIPIDSIFQDTEFYFGRKFDL
jgi:hypothetical protein